MEREAVPLPLAPSRSPTRWLMLALLCAIYFSFGLTVGSIPPLVGPILEDLEISHSQMGLVLGAWQLVYIGTASPLGTLVDRLGIRWSLGMGILLVWLSLVLRGLAVDFYTLFGAVALFGTGGPIISIGTPKVVSLWFEGNQRGIATGIYTTSAVGGMSFALATAANWVMPLTESWRGISLVYGAIVLVTMLIWWAFAREAALPASETSGPSASQDLPKRGGLSEILRLRNVRIALVLALAIWLVNHGLQNWLPTLLQERGMSLSQAGSWTAVSTAVGAIGLLIVPGLARQGLRALAIGLLLVVSGVTTAGLVFLKGPSLIGALLVSSLARSPTGPLLILILMDTPGVGALRIGAAGGVFYAFAEVGGFGGPFLLGFMRDATDSLKSGVLMLSALAVAMVLMMPLIQERREAPAGRENLQ